MRYFRAVQLLALAPLVAGILSPTFISSALSSPVRPTYCAHTPPKGSSERSAIANAMRRDVQSFSGQTVIFTFTHLKVNGNWAYAVTRPQLAKGGGQLEAYEALLQRSGGWRVVGHVLGGEEVSPTVQRRRLRAKFRGVPRDIFPS